VKPAAALFLAVSSSSLAAWTPPEKPDPQRILHEARDDRQAGRNEDALAKHVWFHENALQYEPTMKGVRRSFALADWRMLGYRYQPAMKRLQEARDYAAKRTREGKDAWEQFGDVLAINDALDEDAKTRELFIWLDKNKPEIAREVYPRAQPILVQAKDYALCGKYLDAPATFDKLAKNYRNDLLYANTSTYRNDNREFAVTKFSNETSVLVALLVVNGKKPEAKKIADDALKLMDTPAFGKLLASSLEGKVPDPWPSDSLRQVSRAWERVGGYLGF
jgi:tetratricopeptide (TPR) repeat protein